MNNHGQGLPTYSYIYARSEYHTQLAKMSFDEYSISQLECIFILIITNLLLRRHRFCLEARVFLPLRLGTLAILILSIAIIVLVLVVLSTIRGSRPKLIPAKTAQT